MKLNKRACKNLASAVIMTALEDYEDPALRPEVQAFLFSPRFILYAALTDWNAQQLRGLFMKDKDCKTCKNRYKENICVKCYETDPTKVHNYYKLDDRKKGLKK